MRQALARIQRDHSEAALSAILAIQIVTVFVVAPLAATAELSIQWVEMLRLGLAAVTILIVARRAVTRAIVGLASLATLAASLQWRIGEPAAVVTAIKLVITIGFDVVVAAMVAGMVFRGGRVTVHRILGAVILYLYVALIFAGLYGIAAAILHDAFAGLSGAMRARFVDLLYYSLGDLTTAGVGALTPVHPIVRSLASLEAMIGQLFPATLLARLVTLHAAAGTDGR